MGASTSRPADNATTPPQATVEKPGFPVTTPTTTISTASSSNTTATSSRAPLPHASHHSADRLARIAGHNGRHNTVRLEQGEDDLAGRIASTDLQISEFKTWGEKIEADPVARLASLTLHNTNPLQALHRRKAEVADIHIFNTTIDHESNPVANQMSSGRCWIFATCNVIRNEIIKTLSLDNFQLSQSYLHFFDKLEKANYFLENTLDLYDKEIDSRTYGYLKGDPINDGGQFSMVANLLLKYGVVPQAVYPETYNTSNTNKINEILTRKLREYAIILRDLKSETVSRLQSSGCSITTAENKADELCRRRKNFMMEEVYRVMVILDGAPPQPDEEFTWEYKDKKGQVKSLTMNPKDFLKKFAPHFNPVEQVSLVDDPRRKRNVLMTVDRLGNVWGGNNDKVLPVQYVNTEIDVMKKAAIDTIKAGFPVWFGCDVGEFSDSNLGIMDVDLFDYKSAFGFGFNMTKAQRIDLGESSMTHAMVLTGVHLDKMGKPVRWRVENSWGSTPGDRGYFVASDRWFDEYVLQVVARKAYVPAELYKLHEEGINSKTTVLPAWDPFGSLA